MEQSRATVTPCIARNVVISVSVRAAHVRVQERRRQDAEGRRRCQREGQLRALSLDRRRQRDHRHRRLQSSEQLVFCSVQGGPKK